jgi:tetratricopeptide (TPR) repeat protein
VNSDADIQKALEAVVLYRIDSEKGDGKDLAKQFKIRAYPTFIVANSNGEMIDIWLGYTKDDFLKTLPQSLLDLSTIEQKKALNATRPTLASLVTLGRYSSAMREYKEAVTYYQQARLLSSQASSYEYEIFDNTAEGYGKKVFTYDEVSKAADAALASPATDQITKIGVAGQMAGIANNNGKPADVARFLEAGLNVTSSDTSADFKQSHANLMVDFSLMVKHDTATAVEYKKATMSDDWQQNASDLNSFAWWCFEHNTNLDEAERLSQKAVELAKPGKEKAMNLDTLAEIKHARGKTAEAIELEKKAVTEEPTNDFYPTQVERFQKAMAGTK